MPRVESLFATRLDRAEIGSRAPPLNRKLAAACRSVAAEDRAGQAWVRANGYPG